MARPLKVLFQRRATVVALPRAPNFIVPVYEGGAALASNNIKWAAGEFRYRLGFKARSYCRTLAA